MAHGASSPNRTAVPPLGSALGRVLPWITAAWVLLELLSLRLPLLDRFFFDTAHAHVQGVDYYSLPKAWLNLVAGRSPYGTFDPPAFGPQFTWYLAHPALAVVLGWPLSHFAPENSYGVFTLLSLGLMAIAAAALARESDDPLTRGLIWLLLLGAFPTFAMLYVGNVQSVLVLGCALLCAGLLRLLRERPHGPALVLAGLLLSLFSKPVVLILLPLLLLLRETRRPAWLSLAAYCPVSLLFLVMPALNPQGTGMGRRLYLALHPGVAQATMNIYLDRFQLTPDMRDNSVHWFNLVAQSGFRLQHVDVYSLPVFLDTLFRRHTPGWLYLLPTLAVLLGSVLVPRLRAPRQRLGAALLLSLAALLSYFLTYPTVWEYQYTAVLPVAATLLAWGPGSLVPRALWRSAVGLCACVALPSLYFLSASAAPTSGELTLTRLDRVVPVTLAFLLLLYAVFAAVRPVIAGHTAPALGEDFRGKCRWRGRPAHRRSLTKRVLDHPVKRQHFGNSSFE